MADSKKNGKVCKQFLSMREVGNNSFLYKSNDRKNGGSTTIQSKEPLYGFVPRMVKAKDVQQVMVSSQCMQ